MFKYIVLYSVLALVAMAQPLTNGNEDDNGLAITTALDAATTETSQATSAASQVVTEASITTNNISTQASTTVPNISTEAATTVNPVTEQAATTASSILIQILENHKNKKATLGQVIERLGEAAKTTIIEEKESIVKALKSIKNATGNTLKAGLDTLHTGFNMILIVPKFALNALNLNNTSNATL